MQASTWPINSMSLWPPGVVQRLSSQAPPQHVVQHPRAPIVGWSSAQQQHPAQLQQLCLLLQHEQQQQLQQQHHWEHSVHHPPEGYIYRDAAHQHQQQMCAPGRSLATVAVAAAAAAAAAVAGARAAADVTACWPASAFNNISNVVEMQHELVQWPQDKQPKLGHITKNKLRKLTVSSDMRFISCGSFCSSYQLVAAPKGRLLLQSMSCAAGGLCRQMLWGSVATAWCGWSTSV
jgi:hypothetical protein